MKMKSDMFVVQRLNELSTDLANKIYDDGVDGVASQYLAFRIPTICKRRTFL